MRAPTPRLAEVLGQDLDQLSHETIARLVEQQVAEDDDLDFKGTLYGRTDSDKRELAGDIASLANHNGGVIVVGIGEENACAGTLTPVELGDAEEGRMRQIVASHVAPVPHWTIVRVPSDDVDGSGWYVLVVPRSSDAPHAVRVNESLRYPRRDGTTTRWLAESEVADSYRNRFAAAGTQVARVEELLDEGARLAGPSVAPPYVVIACVPNRPGQWTIDRTSRDEAVGFPQRVDYPHFIDCQLGYYAATAGVGYRRVVLRFSGAGGADPLPAIAHLHADGSSMVAVSVGSQGRDQYSREALNELWVTDEQLTQEAVASLAMVATHARSHAGCSGDAAIATTIFHGVMPVWVVHNRQHTTQKWRADSGVTEVPRMHHTLSLDDMSTATGLIAGSRLVLTDLFQALQVPECHPFTDDNRVRRRYWYNTQRIDSVCAAFDLVATDNVD